MPGKCAAGYRMRKTLWNQKLRIIFSVFRSHTCHRHFCNRRNAKIPGKIFQRDIFGMNDGKRHHIPMHHKKRPVSIQCKIFLLFNQQTDRFDRIFNTVRIRRVVFSCLGTILINMILSFGKTDRNAFRPVFRSLFCCRKRTLDRFRTVFFPGWIGAIFEGVDYDFTFFLCRNLCIIRRKRLDHHTQRQHTGNECFCFCFCHPITSSFFFIKYNRPVKSASPHPIGIDHQIPVTPIAGTPEST